MYTSSRPDTTGVRHPVVPGDQPCSRPQQAPLPTLRQKVGQPGRITRVASPQLSRRSKGVRASRGLSKIALQAAAAEAAEPTTRTEKEWRLLETEASKSVTLASELIPAISKAEEKARFARITADIAARLAGEADAKAREEQPKAVQALEGLRKQVQEWQGLGSGTSAKGLHSLASSRLAAWCAMHVDDATSYQEVDSQEIGIGGLEGPALLAAEVAAAEVDGKQYAVAAIAIGEEGTSKGQLAGTHLHWGCCQKEGSGWKAPPPGWHTDPNVSHPKGSAWETPFALYAPKKDGQVDAASGAYVLGLQLPLQDVLRGGGIEFILKRDRQPEWVSNVHRRNFFVSLAKAAEFFDKPQEPESSAPETVTLPEDSPEWVVLDAAEGRTASGQARSPGNLRQQLQALAQLLESPPPAAEGNGKVAALTSELEQVATHVSAAEQAAESAREGQEIASSSAREVQQAEQELRETQAKAESAILAARQKTALLKGKNEEVSLEDLLRITKDRLAQSAAAGPSASGEDASKVLEPVEFAARMDGLLGHVAGHAQLTRDESGKPSAVVTLAAAESFPDGLLQDAKLHWGVCLHEESGWARAPQGWQAYPQGSHEAGGVATETPLERVDLPDGSSNANAAAYAATVQLPLESGLVGALSFVVHAPGGRWVACNRANSRQDFFFSLSPLMKAVRKEQKEKAAKKGPKSVEAATEASTEASSKPAASASGDESAGQPAASDQDLGSEGGLGSSK